MPSSAKPNASAILAVYNSETTITPCLDSLLFQSVPLEIIVVDDGSTDQTLALLRHYPQITIFTQSHAGPALARNLGSSHATTEILLFVDADMVFDHHYVRDLIAPIQSKKVVGTYTFEERVANWNNIWARCWNMQEGWAECQRFPPHPPQWGTDFRAILKSAFDGVGGFDNIGYTDTWSLFHKLGKRPLATAATCYHRNPDSLLAIFRQARWAAKRPYKYGIFGTLYALLRTSLPVSLGVGIVASFTHREPVFLFFKLTYDLGRFMGILEMLFLGRLAK